MFLRGVLLALACIPALAMPLRAVAAPWIVLSDLHVDFNSNAPAWAMGQDTGEALFSETVAELKRIDPDAPVVIVAGDIVAHSMRSNRIMPTIVEATRRLHAAFPKAQFVWTLGNNDSTCGDYETQRNGTFLHDVGAAWAPLVKTSSPEFSRTFSDTGTYAVRLPNHVTAVALDDVPLAFRYRDACTGDAPNPVARALNVLNREAAQGAAAGRRVWVVTHLPPGVDAYTSTHLTRQLVTVPFLRQDAQDAFVGALTDPANRVALLVAGHSHKFGFRAVNGVPALLAPSISPLMHNAPSFLLLDVTPAGDVTNVVQYARAEDAWQRLDDTRALGMPSLSIAGVAELNDRIDRDPALRQRFARDYDAGGGIEISSRNWRGYWCAQTGVALDDYRACIAAGSAGQLRTRTQLLLLAVFIGGIFLASVLFLRRFSATNR